MKTIIYILLYILLTIGYYMLLSSIGILFNYTYNECYSNSTWFMWYLLIFHWWLVILSLKEYYSKYLEDIHG